MPFTDNDLRFLAKNIAQADRTKNMGGWFLNLSEWDALLTRLEAAEKVCESCHIDLGEQYYDAELIWKWCASKGEK